MRRGRPGQWGRARDTGAGRTRRTTAGPGEQVRHSDLWHRAVTERSGFEDFEGDIRQTSLRRFFADALSHGRRIGGSAVKDAQIDVTLRLRPVQPHRAE